MQGRTPDMNFGQVRNRLTCSGTTIHNPTRANFRSPGQVHPQTGADPQETSVGKWANTTSRKAPLPPDWQQRRLTVFARDGHRCTDCGWYDPTDRTLEADHLGQPNDHRLASLTTRCGWRSRNNCHGKKTSNAGAAARPTERRTPEQHPGLT